MSKPFLTTKWAKSAFDQCAVHSIDMYCTLGQKYWAAARPLDYKWKAKSKRQAGWYVECVLLQERGLNGWDGETSILLMLLAAATIHFAHLYLPFRGGRNHSRGNTTFWFVVLRKIKFSYFLGFSRVNTIASKYLLAEITICSRQIFREPWYFVKKPLW